MLLRPWSTVHDGSNGALLFARQPVARAVRGTVAPENIGEFEGGLVQSRLSFPLAWLPAKLVQRALRRGHQAGRYLCVARGAENAGVPEQFLVTSGRRTKAKLIRIRLTMILRLWSTKIHAVVQQMGGK